MSSGRIVVPPYSTTTCTACPSLIFGRGWTVSSQMRAASSCTCQYAAPSTVAPGVGRRELSRRLAVDRQRSNVHPAQVQIEPVEILGGDEVDGGDTIEPAFDRGRSRRRRGVGDVEVVVLNVVSAVARVGEVVVAGTCRSGRVSRLAGRLRGGDRASRRRQCCDGHEHCRGASGGLGTHREHSFSSCSWGKTAFHVFEAMSTRRRRKWPRPTLGDLSAAAARTGRTWERRAGLWPKVVSGIASPGCLERRPSAYTAQPSGQLVTTRWAPNITVLIDRMSRG